MLIGPRNLSFTLVAVLRRGRSPVQDFGRGLTRPIGRAAHPAATAAAAASMAAAPTAAAPVAGPAGRAGRT